ncbi:MAG: DUF4271 domain-containing protein [Saprospirales bacterium]|nr:MAG: DUF4271 domain-containing protein [Saprospirales bacterium]
MTFRYAFILLFLLLPLCLGSQNPFDLKHRLISPTERTKEFIDTFQTQESLTIDEMELTVGIDTVDYNETVEEKPEAEKEKLEKTIEPSEDEDKVNEEEGLAHQKDIAPHIRDKDESGQMLMFIFLLCTVFLALIIAADRSVLNKLYRSLINDNFLSFFMREQKSGTSLQLFFLHSFFIINLGLLAYFVLHDLIYIDKEIKLWQCIVFIGGIYLVRHVFMTYLNLFAKAEKEINRFYFTIIIFNIFVGLLIFPLNAFAAFAPDIISNTAIYISLVLVILFYITRQLRGLFIGSKFLIDHQFHFFIYLCTVEIAPILVLGKFFTSII